MADASAKPISVLFVCLGNICRSPMAEAVFRHHTATPTSSSSSSSFSSPSSPPPSFIIDSCGTAGYHVGAAPDDRTLATLAAHGITDYAHGARRFRAPRDFEAFDWIFAMDRENLAELRRLREGVVRRRREKGEVEGEGKGEGEEGLGRVMLWGEFGGKAGGKGEGKGEEVIDPYYGAQDGFTVAYKQMVRFTEGFLESLKSGGERL